MNMKKNKGHARCNAAGLKFLTEKVAVNKTFVVFHPLLMQLGEVVVPICTTTSPSFIKIKKFYY